MPLGTNQVTTTTADVFRPEVWSLEVLRATEDALVMAQLVKRYDTLVQGKGDVINIPNLANLSANTKSANTQVTLQAATEVNSTISINTHQEASFMVEDMAEAQANYDLLAEYTSKASNSGLIKSSLILGTSEMTTLSKQEKSLQLQRLSEMTSKEEAIVRTYWN